MAKHSVSKTKPVTGEISGDRSLRFLLLLLLLHYKTERLYRGYGEGDPELEKGGSLEAIERDLAVSHHHHQRHFTQPVVGRREQNNMTDRPYLRQTSRRVKVSRTVDVVKAQVL